MSTQVKELGGLLGASVQLPAREWQLRAVMSEECLGYVAWNEKTREAVAVDPKRDDLGALVRLAETLAGYRWLAVIDSHTHADHITCAADFAARVGAPVVMHEKAPSRRVDLRVARDTELAAQAAPLRLLATPGHTPDSLTVLWGPFVFGGDTVLYGDSGRDDLPGGDPAAHFESLEKLKRQISPEQLLLPGHDHKGGRASTWAKQLEVNASLRQERDDFVRESLAFDVPAPKLLKESLRENFK